MGARSSKNTTQNNRSDGHLLEYSRNTFVRGGGGTNFVIPSSLTASGGTILSPGNGYKYHIFLGPGTFSVSNIPVNAPGTMEVLVVAGGGGGGDTRGGGGGAGGVRYDASFPVSITPGSYSVTVGSGGAGAVYNGSRSTRGSNSIFGSYTAYGGGGGMGRYPYPDPTGNPARDGGSGGGGGVEAYNVFGYGYNPSTPAPVLSAVPLPSPYPITQGNNGGTTAGPSNGAGGGGYASVGAPETQGRHGGLAGSFPVFPSTIIGPAIPVGPSWNNSVSTTGYFAGGGGGGDQSPSLPSLVSVGGRGPTTPGNAPSSQPYGGGGNGGQGPSSGNPPIGASGISYTGGGGGGGADNSDGGSGGSGIVLIRYVAS